MNRKEREELTRLIEAEGGANWWQPALFEQHIRPQLLAALRMISAPPVHEENFNCFVYALRLEHDPDFLGGRNPVQKEFIQHLLHVGALVRTDAPLSGDLVFYEDEAKRITHGGVMQSGELVLSKWMWGPTFEHALWDVPSSFGDSVFYTRPLPQSAAKAAYEEYKDSGVAIAPIS